MPKDWMNNEENNQVDAPYLPPTSTDQPKDVVAMYKEIAMEWQRIAQVYRAELIRMRKELEADEQES